MDRKDDEGRDGRLLPPVCAFPGNLGPDGRRFELGAVWRIHAVGRYQIVEYVNDMSAAPSDPHDEHGKMRFAVYVEGKPAGLVCGTLDEALLGAVCAGNGGLKSFENVRTLALAVERKLLDALDGAQAELRRHLPEDDAACARVRRAVDLAAGRGDADFEGSR